MKPGTLSLCPACSPLTEAGSEEVLHKHWLNRTLLRDFMEMFYLEVVLKIGRY